MAAQKRTQARALELEPLNLTPLLDVLFNLIFFFVLATTLKEEIPAISVNIPESATPDSIPLDTKEWIVTFSADGKIFLNEDEVTSGELKTRVEAVADDPDGPERFRVRADGAAPIQLLFDVLDILEKLDNVFVEVDRKRKRP